MGTRSIGIICIICAALVSFGVAVSVDMTTLELGALFNYFLPPIIGVVCLIVFLIVCWIWKRESVRIVTIVFLCSYLVYAGVQLRNTFVPFPF